MSGTQVMEHYQSILEEENHDTPRVGSPQERLPAPRALPSARQHRSSRGALAWAVAEPSRYRVCASARA
jgi:hypothetical protein